MEPVAPRWTAATVRTIIYLTKILKRKEHVDRKITFILFFFSLKNPGQSTNILETCSFDFTHLFGSRDY